MVDEGGDLAFEIAGQVIIADKRAKATVPTTVPTFGAMADAYVETHEATWRNAKHRYQWRQTLTDYCGPIRLRPVDQIATADVLAVLKPLWSRAPETASRLRGRIQAVLDAAQAHGHIADDKANPARWKGHLDKLLPRPAKLSRGHPLRRRARLRATPEGVRQHGGLGVGVPYLDRHPHQRDARRAVVRNRS